MHINRKFALEKFCALQVVESVGVRLIGEVAAKVRTSHVHHLVRVLHGRGHPDGSRPVEVHVREVVAQLLDEVGAQMAITRVIEVHEVSGSDRALVDVLWNQEEVLEIPPGDRVVQNYARLWIIHFHAPGCFWVALEREDAGVDPLLDDNKVEAWVVALGHSRI